MNDKNKNDKLIVNPTDICPYWEEDINCLLPIKECWSCRYSDFRKSREMIKQSVCRLSENKNQIKPNIERRIIPMKKLKELIEKATSEQKQKALTCKSANEILAFAKDEGVELSTEQAEKILKLITPPYGEVCDDELDRITGGNSKDSNTIKCPNCGSTNTCLYHYASVAPETSYFDACFQQYICNSCGKTFKQ